MTCIPVVYHCIGWDGSLVHWFVETGRYHAFLQDVRRLAEMSEFTIEIHKNLQLDILCRVGN